jgi:hypothetical protein
VNYFTTRVQANLQIMEQVDLIGRTSEFARVFGIEFFHVISREIFNFFDMLAFLKTKIIFIIRYFLFKKDERCLPNNVRYDNLVCYDFRIKTMFCLSLPPVVCRRAHVLFTLFAYSGVQHILCCVFLCLLYPMMPVSLDCPFLIVLRYYLMFIRYIK